MTRNHSQYTDAVGPSPRGACPRLTAPMETGDGLLARLVPYGPIPIEAFASLCAAAGTHGNGLMEITARGSLQVRGLSGHSAPHFADAVATLDIPFSDHVPVIVSPLPDLSIAPSRTRTLAADVCEATRERRLSLAPKVSVLIDDGGPISLDGLAADIRLRILPEGAAHRLLVSVGGDGETATPLGIGHLDDAATLTSDLLAVLAESGPALRARDFVAQQGPAPLLRAAGNRLSEMSKRLPVRDTEVIGLHRLDAGVCAIGVALPFGQAHALDLIALARIAGANGAEWIALAPQRTLLLGPIGEMTAFALGTAADTLGFVVDSRDARRRITACAGAPACAAGYIPSRELAARIAEHLPQGAFALHISGCSKGCAHPKSAPLAIVGYSSGARVVEAGSALHLSDDYLSSDDFIDDVAYKIAMETENA